MEQFKTFEQKVNDGIEHLDNNPDVYEYPLGDSGIKLLTQEYPDLEEKIKTLGAILSEQEHNGKKYYLSTF